MILENGKFDDKTVVLLLKTFFLKLSNILLAYFEFFCIIEDRLNLYL